MTTKNPIEYRKTNFASIEAINTWFSDFSQGKGKDGENLYQRCDGLCSPQYTTIIEEKERGSYDVHAQVVCGPARDKNDNNYNLELFLRWTCEKPRVVRGPDTNL